MALRLMLGVKFGEYERAERWLAEMRKQGLEATVMDV